MESNLDSVDETTSVPALLPREEAKMSSGKKKKWGRVVCTAVARSLPTPAKK